MPEASFGRLWFSLHSEYLCKCKYSLLYPQNHYCFMFNMLNKKCSYGPRLGLVLSKWDTMPRLKIDSKRFGARIMDALPPITGWSVFPCVTNRAHPSPPVSSLLSSLMLFFCLPTLYDLLMCSCCRCEMAVPTISRILFLFHFWPLLYMVSFFITSYRVKYWRNQEWHWSLGLCFQKFCELCSFVPFLRKLQQILPWKGGEKKEISKM